MLAISTLILLLVLSTCNGRTIVHEECPDDTIDFATKVENSSFVVYGKSTGKNLYDENDSMFYVTFQVDCIFKGSAISKHINITQAGQVEGKTYCQDFPAGRGYTIAFLERNPFDVNDTKTFIPADFVEMPFEHNITNELLTNTCGLHQILPLHSSVSITDVCPAVSTDSHCIKTTVQFQLNVNSSGLYPVIITDGSQNGTDNIRSKSATFQIDGDTRNGVNSISISILLILMVILFV